MGRFKLPLSFYRKNDVVRLGKSLLGKNLFTCIDGELTGGMIIETESYAGALDKACHAYGMRKTERTKTMFEEGGIAYVYLCYGMHHLLNVVTNQKEVPEAVLIRAIKPTHGIDVMLRRRNKKNWDKTLTSGPGSLSKALGITKQENGLSFLGSTLWIEKGVAIPEKRIAASPRIGVSYAEEDADLPYRFQAEL